MADNLTREERSRNMSRIRNRDTTPELAVRSLLHKEGYRFRLHRKDLPGTPDIVLPKYKTAIFVHGCFWHRHKGCKYSYTPKTNVEFWNKKFQDNLLRDKKNLKELEAEGWRVLIVWECETSSTSELRKRIDMVLKEPTGGS